jgi:UDP-N-acetylglucosamine/UDP-N-acetylgalactosamine diphosphorylase
MDIDFPARARIQSLLDRGVKVPNPLTLDIGAEVRLDRIAPGVALYPGCRVYGAKTIIAAGAKIGFEGPATVDDCQVGPKAELKGGFFQRATFLAGANLGLAAHVREGCLLEEEAGGAHCVGIKQTILFPFVTLGSLINFCDCLMAGGTSRKDHSEVGSSYIHFNFTPEGDKTTASLIGDVPRGVMLDRPPIFLGGQGGMVGPLRLGYGSVVAAGSILRKDHVEDGRLIVEAAPRSFSMELTPGLYPTLPRTVKNNVLYVANLVALDAWYRHVRKPFFDAMEMGDGLWAGAREKIEFGRKERLSRLGKLADAMPRSIAAAGGAGSDSQAARKRELLERKDDLLGLLAGDPGDGVGARDRDALLAALEDSDRGDYVRAIQALPAEAKRAGTAWLQAIVDDVARRAGAVLPGMYA